MALQFYGTAQHWRSCTVQRHHAVASRWGRRIHIAQAHITAGPSARCGRTGHKWPMVGALEAPPRPGSPHLTGGGGQQAGGLRGLAGPLLRLLLRSACSDERGHTRQDHSAGSNAQHDPGCAAFIHPELALCMEENHVLNSGNSPKVISVK